MGEERLKNRSILAIEKKLASELSLDDVVDWFASKDKNNKDCIKIATACIIHLAIVGCIFIKLAQVVVKLATHMYMSVYFNSFLVLIYFSYS